MMAAEVKAKAKGLFVTLLLLSLDIWGCSGTLVGFSYDAMRKSPKSWSPKETLSFLEKNKISSSHFTVVLCNPEAFLDSLSDTQIPINFFLNPAHSKSLLKSKSSAISWLETHIIKHLPHLNISTIVVDTTKQDVTSVLLTLKSIRSVLEIFDLDGRIRVSPLLSLIDLEKQLPSVTMFVKLTKSPIFVETFVDRELSLGDGFIHSVLERAIFAYSLLLPYPQIPFVLSIKISAVPRGVEIDRFTEKLMKSIDGHPQLKDRISGLSIDISSLVGPEKKKLDGAEEVVFPTSHRQLLGKESVTIHDIFAPITVPSADPSPDIVTVPSTNPTTVMPTTSPITIPSTNPTTTPITFPSTSPMIPPITVPATNPVMNPVTNPTTAPVTIPPVTPVTNPVTTPTPNPVNQPVTNPVTTYPFSPPSSMTPVIGTPSTVPISPATGTPSTVPVSPATGTPSTVPVSPVTGTPTGSGQTWCVAKSGAPEDALQDALDYACGIGGADCSTIQMSGSCYNPNTLQAHASYAFNSYYQKNPMPTSCDFGGTATLVTANPSTGTCVFPSSSSTSSVNPGLNPGLNPTSGTGMGTGTGLGTGIGVGTGTGTGSTGIGTGPTGVTPTYGSTSGSGSSVFNTNNSAGSNTVFGSDSPTGTISSGSFCRPGGWILLALTFMVQQQLLH